jgi:hypothetical protein
MNLAVLTFGNWLSAVAKSHVTMYTQKPSSLKLSFWQLPKVSCRKSLLPYSCFPAPDSGRKFKGNFRSLSDSFRSKVYRNWTEPVAETSNGIQWQGNRRNRNPTGRNWPSTNNLGIHAININSIILHRSSRNMVCYSFCVFLLCFLSFLFLFCVMLSKLSL